MMLYKQGLLLSLVFILLHSYRTTAQDSLLTEVEKFGNNPGHLRMFIHAGKNGKTDARPLVVVLHGCGQTASEVAQLTGWNKLADLNDFIVLYPQQRFLNNTGTCFNWFRNADINKGSGECESIYQMIRYMQRHYDIDSSHICITGLSAGAAMSVVMMATHPDLFSAGAIFAGGAYKLATSAWVSPYVMAGTKRLPKDELVRLVAEQNPGYKGKYPLMIIYQGLNDLVVNHKNAGLLVQQWAGINKTDDTADKTETSFMNVADIKRTTYNNSNGEPVVLLYEVDNLGHRVLVKPGPGDDEGGETGTYGADKGYYSIYQTAKEFGILRGKM